MRIFGIIVATILACLVVGFAGYWVGTGGLFAHPVIMVSVTERGDLEISSLQPRLIDIYGVTFNERYEYDVCSSRPRPVFWAHDAGMGGMRGGWNTRTTSVRLREGDTVYALFNAQACGDRIVKAEVSTSRGNFVFRYPRVERNFVGAPPRARTTMVLDRTIDFR